MPRKNTVTLGSLLKSTTSLFNETKDHHIPSIVEFVESPMYLGIKSLYPIQKLILKAFYRGSRGNEDMVLTPEEEALCVQHGLISAKNGDVLGKVKSGELFKELVLVWGRRSGKDFCISIIALYEAMRLLESPGGDPYKVYNLGSAAPFTILTIANSANQAKILFNEIRNKFLASPYFRDKFINEGITTDSIHLLTPKNKEENERWAAKGIAPFAGSVVIQAGHSNSNALVGLSCFVLLLDEVGLYKQTGGASSGDQIYHNLSPTTRTYVRAETVKDENGNLVTKRYYDGKIIAISSPRGMDGIFYELYKKADTISNRLMCRLPTWVVNISHTEQSLRDQEQQMTEEKFMMEYGAEFSGTEGENFFTADLVECCFKNHNFRMAEHGEMGITYFAHLDPALSNHNYALVLLHKHMFLNKDTKKYDFIIVVDHVKLWTPIKGKPIRLGEVDEYMVNLNRLYHLGLVTYDAWNSQSSIEKLRKAGIPALCTPYAKRYQMQIYSELENLVNNGKIKIPLTNSSKILYDEMMNLQRRYVNQGFQIYPKSEGEVKTDDLVDALAGACFNAIKTEALRLPQSKLVNMGTSPSSNSITWRSMSGTPYGYGTGQQVSQALEKRLSYPIR